MNVPNEILQSVPWQYAADVRSGKIVVCRYIKLAVDRFYKLVENSESKGYRLNHQEGMKPIVFSEFFIKHTKGPVAGEPFVLSPYQQFTIYNICAWQKKNTKGEWVRVVKTVYEKVARKNGKTAVEAILGLYFQSMDGEQSPEIYVGATKEAQAKYLWDQAYQFVFTSLRLRQLGFKNMQREIRFTKNLGKFSFLGGDSKTLDGFSPNFVVIDEYHSHKTDGVREVMESAMGARKQPIMYIITTAGFNSFGVCKLYEDVCKEILEGQKEDDSTFIMIHEIDADDDWEDESTWIKANPNLGVSVSLDYLRTEFKKAKNQPSKIPNFKTKHLNLWVDAEKVWIPQEVWDNNKVDHIPNEVFTSYGCYTGLDLSTNTDITAYVAVSEPDNEGNRYVKPFFFCAKDTIEKRSKEDSVPYQYWADNGYLIATPGNRVDYDYVIDKIKETYFDLAVKEVLIDQYNASHMANELQKDNIKCAFYSQGIMSMSYPTKTFEKLVYEGKLKHDGHPILSWMLSGVVIYEDSNENIKVHKGQSNRAGKKRVDGIVATIMAIGASISLQDNSGSSHYNNDNNEIYI